MMKPIYDIEISIYSVIKQYMSRCMRKPTTWTNVIICQNDVMNLREKILACSMFIDHDCVLPQLVICKIFNGF